MSHRNTVTEERLDDLAWGHRLSWNQLAELLHTSVDYLMGRTLDPWPVDAPQAEGVTA